MKGWRVGQPATRPLLFALSLFVPLGATAGTGILDPAPFRFRALVPVDTVGDVRLPLGDDVLDGAAPDLRDVRIADPAGREVPYVLLRGEDDVWPDPVALPVRPEVRAPKEGLAYAVDAAPALARGGLSALDLAVSGHPYVRRVRVDGSADRVHFQPLAGPVTVYSVDVDGSRSTSTHVPLPRGDLRWLRVWVDDPSGGGAAVTGARGVPPPRGPIEDRWIDLPVRPEGPAGADESAWSLELPGSHLPLDRLTVEAVDPLFSRSVLVEERVLSGERLAPKLLGQGRLARVEVGRIRADLRELELRPPTGRSLRLRVHDGDDRPLGIGRVRGRVRGRVLVFRATVKGEHALYFGDPERSRPSYDLEVARDELARLPAASAAAGPRGSNPGWLPPAVAGAAPPIAAPLAEPARWRLRRPLTRPAGAAVVQWELDAAVLSAARPDLGDVRILAGEAQVPFLVEEGSGEARIPVALGPPGTEAGQRTSRYPVTLPERDIPVRELRFFTGSQLFRRQARVIEAGVRPDSTRAGRGVLGEAEWVRRPGEDPAAPLRVTLVGRPGRDLVLEVDDGDNLPLPIEKAEALHPRWRLHAKVPAEGQLVLAYGNAEAVAPRYDLDLLAAEVLSAPAAGGSLGPETGERARGAPPNPEAAERLFLGLAVAALAAMLVVVGWRLLRGVGAPAE